MLTVGFKYSIRLVLRTSPLIFYSTDHFQYRHAEDSLVSRSRLKFEWQLEEWSGDLGPFHVNVVESQEKTHISSGSWHNITIVWSAYSRLSTRAHVLLLPVLLVIVRRALYEHLAMHDHMERTMVRVTDDL